MIEMISKFLNLKYYPHYARKIWWKTRTSKQLKTIGVQSSDNVLIPNSPLVSMGLDLKILIAVVLRTLRAGSIVKYDIPANAIAAGNPAMIIGNIP